MLKSKSVRFLLLPCFLLLFVCLPITGQTSSATLSGVVEDPEGRVVPGTKVSVMNPATGLIRTVVSDESGAFVVPLLPPASYTVMAEANGFKRIQFPDIVLNVGDQRSLRIRLEVGDVTSEVEVRADASLVRTDSSVGTTIDHNFAQNLPLNGRSFQSLILLTPGVTVVPSGNNRPGQFSVNGQRSDANYVTVDGVSANTGISVNTGNRTLSGGTPGETTTGGTSGLVSVDALEEFKIQTSTYSAEYGRQPGGQISLVTRSGKNTLQASLFEYFRNEKLDANDWFANSRGENRAALRQNIFGGTLGGPIILPNFGDDGSHWYSGRDKSFFFFSYEGTRLRLPRSETSNVPSLRLRNLAPPGLRTLLDAFPLPSEPELVTNTQCPILTAPNCAPNGRLYGGIARFIGVYSDPSNADIAGIRLDHILNNKVALFGRYNYALSNSLTRRATMTAQINDVEIKTQTLTLGTTWAARSNISNDLRLNYTRDESLSDSNLDSFGGAVPIGLENLIPDPESKGKNVQITTFSLSLASGNASYSYRVGQAITQRQWNIIDNITWIKGNHLFKFGFDFRRLEPIWNRADYSVLMTFNSEVGIQNAAPSITQVSSSRAVRPVFSNISFYGHDTWKISRQLTLDMGLRWEINPPPSGDGKLLVAVLGMDNVSTARVASTGTPIYKTDYKAFAPRFGFAYLLSDAKNGSETIVRGGFGVYYDVGNGSAGRGFNGFPFSASVRPTNVTIPLSSQHAVPPLFPTTVTPSTNLVAFAPDFRLPHTFQWNLSIERTLGNNQTISATYVAAAGRQLTASFTVNRAISGVRQNNTFGDVDYIFNRPKSDFHSMQLQYRRRLTNGLQAVANYTYAHALDESSNELGFVFERGNADFDVRHNFSGALTYELPGRKLKGMLGAFLGNWSLDTIVHAQTGLPLNLRAGQLNLSDGTLIDLRPDLITGQPIYINDPTVPGGRRFNSLAFAQPFIPGTTQLRQGTLGRNVLRGLSLYQADFGLRRKFGLTERLNLQLKAEAFNVFNHPNFGGYELNINNPTFGVPLQMLGQSLGGLSALYQIGGPRSIQLSARITFN